MKIRVLTLLMSVFYLYSCGGDGDNMPPPDNNPPPTTTVTYTKDIRPIVMTTCATANCHLGSTGASGFGLETYTLLKDAAINRPLYTRIQSTTNSMPASGRMSQTNINLFLAWRDQGYLEN
ncbi:MAG: hypothetical protein OEL54_00380 [Flavobacteriaceae bacterium]|nr:hypothetical protein [Flavobacteriaceae bacterium]